MFDMKCVLFVCLSLYILGVNAGKVSFIDPCHWKDSECLLKSSKKALPYFVNGIPEMEIPSMNPLVLKDINGDNGDLQLKFNNLIVEGLADCKLIHVGRSEKNKIELELECPITAKGQYSLKGKLYVIDVYGEGDCEIKTKNIKLFASILLKTIQKDGKDYYKFGSFDYKYEPIDKILYKFGNLYGGDDAKAEPIKAILDENWKEIITEIGKPVIKQIITQCVKAIEPFFRHVPCNELELD